MSSRGAGRRVAGRRSAGRRVAGRVAAALLTAALLACSDGGEPAATPGRDGRWLVINYWAVWCAPCREEIPELNRLASEQAARVAVLGVEFDGKTGPALAAARSTLGIAFASADPALLEALALARPMVLPTTYVVDPAGVLRHTLQGPQTYSSLLALTVGEDAPPAPQ